MEKSSSQRPGFSRTTRASPSLVRGRKSSGVRSDSEVHVEAPRTLWKTWFISWFHIPRPVGGASRCSLGVFPPGVDSPFFSTIVLFKNRLVFLPGLVWFFRKKDAWKDWTWKLPLEPSSSASKVSFLASLTPEVLAQLVHLYRHREYSQMLHIQILNFEIS